MDAANTLLNAYRDLSLKEKIYLKTRCLVSPIAHLEGIIPEKGKIYDLGCGAGLLSNLLSLKSEKRQVVGIDSARDKIDIAMKARGKRQNIEFKIGNIMNFYLDNPDIIVMCDVLHHIPFSEHEKLLRYVFASLDKGGFFILQDIDKKPFLKYIFALGIDKITNMLSSVYYRTSRETENLLRKIGFYVDVLKLDKDYPIAAIVYKCTKP